MFVWAHGGIAYTLVLETSSLNGVPVQVWLCLPKYSMLLIRARIPIGRGMGLKIPTSVCPSQTAPTKILKVELK